MEFDKTTHLNATCLKSIQVSSTTSMGHLPTKTILSQVYMQSKTHYATNIPLASASHALPKTYMIVRPSMGSAGILVLFILLLIILRLYPV